jgi:protein tyrosine/serine phosphatase
LALLDDSRSLPILVHCNAGAERTGCAVILYRHVVHGKAIDDVDRRHLVAELAGLLRTSDPKEATNIYEQLKREYPNSAIVDEADRKLQSVSPKS